MMRVGILGHDFINWGGGIDFLRAVASSLAQANKTIELHALLPIHGPRLMARNKLRSTYHAARALLGGKPVSPQQLDGSHVAELASGVESGLTLHAIDIGVSAIAHAGRKLALDVVIPAFTPLPDEFQIPWVGYIFDFQHRYFPQHFEPNERVKRDRQFSAMLSSARAIIVNARSVADDIARFHPEARAHVFALPFSAAPQPAWLLPGESAAPRYGIHRPYFIVCNQFWKHKDHATAFAAFAEFAATHPDVDLVCTGHTTDYRDPNYFPTLQRSIVRAGISPRVHILGMVPKGDQIALIKGALALIQPTLFEGGPGGGAVYDAVSLGLRCLVSDISVNRELDEPEVAFFAAGDAAALAESMRRIISESFATCRNIELLSERGHVRRAACGEQLLAAIAHVRSSKGHDRQQ